MSYPSTQVNAEIDGGVPAGGYEAAVLAIWQQVLGRTDIGLDDDFLTLGDHSLAPTLVARIRKSLGVEIPVMDFFESRTVTSLAAAIAAKVAATKAAEPRAIAPRGPDAEPVLSFDQQRLWLENQLLPSVVYNVHMRRRLIGPLDVDVVHRSVRAIMARHEALRSRFPTVDGRPIQVIDELHDDWGARVEDLSDVAGDRMEQALKLLDEESTTPFDLTEGPLLRCMLVRLGESEHLLGVTVHHIVSDTWSLALFVRELSAFYEAGGDPAKADLPPLPIQYADYALWQRERLVGDALEQQVGYWRQHLSGAPPVLALPTAQRRTTTQRAAADRMESVLTREETSELQALCRAHGVTPFMALLAGLTTVFSRWTGQTDVVIGVPLAGRTTSGTDHLIGFFVNVLPFRIDLSGNPTFAELLRRVRRVALDGYDHADAPLDALVEDLRIARDPRRTPLFEVVLNVVGSPEAERAMGLTVEPMETPSLFSRFDLTVTAQESDGRLRLQLDFASDRCDAEMVRVLVQHVHRLLHSAVAEPGRGILDYELELPAELSGAVSDPSLALDAAVDSWSAGTAVVDAAESWSYPRLASTASDIAQYLAANGVASGDQVAVVRRPGAEFVAALLGCLKAGAAYEIVESAEPDGSFAAILDDLSAVASHDAPSAVVASRAPHWAVDRFGITSADRVAVLSSAPGHLESALSTAFHAGAAFVIPNCSFAADAATITDWLRDNAISVLYATSSVLRALAGAGVPTLTHVFVDNSGDLLSHDVERLRELSPDARFIALYRTQPNGRPQAVYEVPDDWCLPTAPLRVPIGSPLPQGTAEVLRPNGLLAAVGELGELRFDSKPTGDLVRRWSDGSLEFVCRTHESTAFDIQETAATLWDVPEARDALVTVETGADGDPVLTGYVAGPDADADVAVLHNFLRTRLPAYLIPERIVVLPALPRTPWGEYDLAALADLRENGAADQVYVAPRSPMEKALTDLIEEMLKIERVGVYDSFFELGGFSLLATQLATRVKVLYHVDLALRDIFESPTVDELAQLILRSQSELSDVDDLQALLDELELTDEPAPVAAENSPTGYADVLRRLGEQAVFTPDKPDETPETTARALWFAAAGTPRAVTASTSDEMPELDAAQAAALEGLVERRIVGEPLAYLTGRSGFLGLELLTAPGALIPRRGTEILGNAAIGMAGEIADTDGSVRVLDLCTGAGNLAVALAVREPRARVWASDLEAEATAVAARNADFHGVGDRVTVAAGDLFAALDELPGPPREFDLIVCNPPYMPTETMRSMPVAMGGFEPSAAFDGGDVGLTVVYRLIAEAPRHLAPGGWLCFEVGAGMGRVVEKRLAAIGAYGETRLVMDQDGNTRAILARRL